MITPSRELDDPSSVERRSDGHVGMGSKGAGEQAMLQRLAELRIGAILVLAVVLAGCGGGGGSGSGGSTMAESRIDVVVTGLPAGVNAAVAVSDPGGRVVANLTTSGQVFVSGPGAFSVSAGAVMSGTATYVASVVPNPVNVPAPPGITAVDVAYALAPARTQIRAVATGTRFSHLPASPLAG
jgi:hypothetical protein